MSASTLVDLGHTCQLFPSVGSGLVFVASGGIIGLTADLINADTWCNLYAAGFPITTSGQLRLQVQTADATTSGSFTDPTSGMAAADIPPPMFSGGIVWINSGAAVGGTLNGAVSGQFIQSGFMIGAGFTRVGRYARVNVVSGDFYNGFLNAGFVTNYKVIGSGGGFTLAPGSGTVSV